MIYRVYPIVLGGSTTLLTVAGFTAIITTSDYRWPLILVPFIAVFGGMFAVGLLESRFPRIRFVNEAEIDGLGYTHQPLDAILPVFLFGFFSALAIIVRGWTS